MTVIIAVIIGAAINLAGAYLIGRTAAVREIRKEARIRLFEKQWNLYLDFARTVGRILESAKTGRLDEAQVLRDLMAFASGLWLIGSESVIAAFNTWRQTANNPTDRVAILTRLMDVLKAMRQDLGAADDPTHRDMLALIINDIDQYLTRAPEGPPTP
ncbi:MAG: hypothetical protein A2W34_00050 [Chloroflexi bacterium RBG_16_64_32]|nr:MAG: hypothetical protein A2W34_00050 [Chloroflexi bacterium RBG_16_64_32]